MNKQEKEKHLELIRDVLISTIQGFSSIALWCPYFVVREDCVAYTDGVSIFLGNKFFEFSKVEQLGIFVHEILHIAFCHVARAKTLGVNGLIWNYATDAIINLAIAEMSPRLRLPANHIKLKDLIDNDTLDQINEHQWTADLVYRYFLKEAEKEAEKEQQKKGQANADGKGEDGGGQTGKSSSGGGLSGNYSSEGSVFGKGIPGDYESDLKSTAGPVTDKEGYELPDYVKEHNDLPEDIQQDIWAKRLERAAQGDTPSGIFRKLFNEFPKTKTPWQAYFRKYMTTPLLPKRIDNWSRPSRRMISQRSRIFDPTSKKKDGIARAGIVIDTSGSIDNKILMQFVSEVEKIQKLTGAELELIFADAEVSARYTVKNDGTFKSKIMSGKIVAKGGGGTDFRPAIKALEKTNISVLVYLTDLYGYFPDKAPTKFPVIWAAISDKDVPFGKIVRLED